MSIRSNNGSKEKRKTEQENDKKCTKKTTTHAQGWCRLGIPLIVFLVYISSWFCLGWVCCGHGRSAGMVPCDVSYGKKIISGWGGSRTIVMETGASLRRGCVNRSHLFLAAKGYKHSGVLQRTCAWPGTHTIASLHVLDTATLFVYLYSQHAQKRNNRQNIGNRS